MSEQELNQVKALFNSITPIPENEWEQARRFLSFKDYKKGEHLLVAGEMASHSFVILDGIVRIYYLTDHGKEFNKGFAAENQVTGSVSSIIGKLPSRFSIQALEPTKAALLPRDAIEGAYERHRCWDRFGRIVAECTLVYIEQRDGEILDSLEKQYLRLLKTYPDLAERVAQYHIASYLGITDVALSRLRRRIRESGAQLE